VRGLFLLHLLMGFGVLCVWVTLALGVAWLITFLCPRRAAVRHVIRLAALIVILAGPAVAPLLPPHYPLRVPFPAIGRAGRAENPPSSDSPPPVVHHRRPIADWRLLGISLAGLWLGGVIVAGHPALLAPLALRRLYRNSRPAPAELADRAGSGGRWRLRLSTRDDLPTPLTWGIFRPVVLLPKDATSWPSDRLEAVLLHERAHIRRGDSLTGFVAFLVCGVYWFHPLVWSTARAMRQDAEIAADDQVLAAGVKPSFYASELLQLAARNPVRARAFAVAGASSLGASKIEARISSVIDPAIDRRTLAPKAIAAILAGVLIAATLAMAARPSVSARIMPADRLVPMILHRAGALTPPRPIRPSDASAPRAGRPCPPATADVRPCALN